MRKFLCLLVAIGSTAYAAGDINSMEGNATDSSALLATGSYLAVFAPNESGTAKYMMTANVRDGGAYSARVLTINGLTAPLLSRIKACFGNAGGQDKDGLLLNECKIIDSNSLFTAQYLRFWYDESGIMARQESGAITMIKTR